jgi:CubicO group peptidase (beta-lactamase class C family)
MWRRKGRLPPSTPFQVASISKQFTAAAIFFLWDRGAVRLDDPVRKFVPELPALTQDITVADLLHHTSGLRDIFPLLEVAAPPADPRYRRQPETAGGAKRPQLPARYQL